MRKLTTLAIWLQWWMKAREQHDDDSFAFWLGVYGALAAITIIGCAVAERLELVAPLLH
jgi:hypothetical protein